MTEYRKVYAYHEKNDGMYELKSYWTSSETTQFESGENLEEYRTTTENNINLKADRIEYDLDAGMLYLYSDETKIDEIPFRVSIKPKVNLGDIDDLQITQDNSAIKLSWDDPIDIEFSGLKIVEWAGTKVVRKVGSCPDSIEDGTLVIDNKTRNAYSSTPYSDSGLTNGVEYYYRFFPYDTEGNIIGDTCGEIIRVITLVPIEIPTVTGTYTYTGSTISPTFVNYDSEKMTRSGANSAKNAGTYTVTFTPKDGYMWTDTTVEAKEVAWTINPATISVVPSQSGTLTYNEQSQSPIWSNYNSDQLTISGDTSGTNAGNYTATFTPKANYTWGDGSTSKNVIWSIGKAVISVVPSQDGEITYNGELQYPVWTNYNSNQLNISGDISGIDVGSYYAIFTPTQNYMWEDGSLYKSVEWIIAEEIIELSALKFSSDNNFTLSASKVWNGTMEYSLDNGHTWTTWTGTQLNGNENNDIYIRGINNTNVCGSTSTVKYPWTFTGKYCTGNIETLLDYQTVENGEHPTMSTTWCFRYMFYNCTSLITAPELPSTTLAAGCYSNMFYGCKSLTTAPELPATTLTGSCYASMFSNCTSLIIPPKLPATTVGDTCYDSMFKGCTSLTTLPELPATTLNYYTYRYMFQNCSLIKLSTTQTGIYQYEYTIPINKNGVSSGTNALQNMFTSTGGTFTGTPTFNKTYYTNNKPIK